MFHSRLRLVYPFAKTLTLNGYRYSFCLNQSARDNAMTIFQPSCPLPPTGTSVVSNPNIRSTFQILWSCITVLILCTWSVLHLNVPVQLVSVIHGRAIKIKKAFYTMWRKTRWMIFAFVAPEVLLGAAAVDLLSAMTSMRDMRDLAGEDGVEWQLCHGFLANMGGFAVRFDDVQNKVSLNSAEAL